MHYLLSIADPRSPKDTTLNTTLQISEHNLLLISECSPYSNSTLRSLSSNLVDKQELRFNHSRVLKFSNALNKETEGQGENV